MTDPRASALEQLNRTLGFFGRVEAKAAFLFTIDIGLIGYTASNAPLRVLTSPRMALATIAVLLLLLSVTNLYAAFFPHLDNGRQGLIYFGDISALDADEYIARAKTQSDEEATTDILWQVWRNAQILKIKFDRTACAFRFTISALPFWALFLLAVSLRAGHFPKGS